MVIATNWLNTKREKRKEVQDWYEQRYIMEGIDPLLTYFTNLTLQFMPLPDNKILPLPDAIVPIEALTRIEVLLGVSGGMEFLSTFIGGVNASLVLSEEYQSITILPLFRLCETLYQLRQEVLRLVPHKINRKNQELDLVKSRDDIVRLVMNYNEDYSELKRKKHEMV